jgi:hypothetical protein
MNFYYIKKSDNLENVIMGHVSYKNLTLNMSTGDYCTHDVRACDSIDEYPNADHVQVNDSGDVMLLDSEFSNRSEALFDSIKNTLKRIEALMSDLKGEHSKAAEPSNLRLVHSTPIGDVDLIKANMKAFDRRQKRINSDRQKRNHFAKKSNNL